MLRPSRSISPIVDPSAFVDVSAQVIGDVHIGPESSTWVNVVDDYVRSRLDFQAAHPPA